MSNTPVTVNVRVEDGNYLAVFDGSVKTFGKQVTAETGGTHLCDGTNGNEYPFPGPTCTSALDDASRPTDNPRPFIWDGIYYPNLDDFQITKIKTTAPPGKFWSLWLNYKFANIGGGQLHIKEGDSVLWALIPEDSVNGVPTSIPLKLKGAREGNAGQFTVTVINGSNRSPVQYARIKCATSDVPEAFTDKYGQAQVELPPGNHMLRALRGDDIVSNMLTVMVTSLPLQKTY